MFDIPASLMGLCAGITLSDQSAIQKRANLALHEDKIPAGVDHFGVLCDRVIPGVVDVNVFARHWVSFDRRAINTTLGAAMEISAHCFAKVGECAVSHYCEGRIFLML